MNGPHVAFETDRFRNDQPDDEIDQWFLGEDLAKWLHDGLVRQERVTSRFEPLEEDWGWTFGVRHRHALLDQHLEHVDVDCRPERKRRSLLLSMQPPELTRYGLGVALRSAPRRENGLAEVFFS